MTIRKFKVEYWYVSEDSKGREKVESLGVNTIWDFGKSGLSGLAFRQASFEQQKANRLKFFEVK